MKKVNFKKVKYFLTILLVGVVIFGFGGCLQSKELFLNKGFYKTSDMTIPRRNHVATLLQDGMVLITGGYSETVKYGPTASAEIYDPKTSRFTKISDMTEGRSNHTATLLDDGRVLIAGGAVTHPYSLSSAEIFDPKTNVFTKTGEMHLGRHGQAAILLNNGKVLIIGGNLTLKSPIPPKVDPSILNPEVKKYMHYGELYDPEMGTFTLTGESKGWYSHPVATMLPDGRVLVVVSQNRINEIYDPIKDAFVQADYTTKPFGDTTATLLNNNKVLIAGSVQDNYANLYDIKKRKFKASKGKLHGFLYNASGLTSTLLNNGNVLLIGYSIKGGYENLYIPKLDMFIITSRMNNAVTNHTATELKNGDVLITGGEYIDKNINKNSMFRFKVSKKAELYKY